MNEYFDPLYKTLTIKEIHPEANDVKTFIFDQESTSKINYQPGQYLTLVHHLPQETIRRSYSITSVPGLNELLSILVKRIDNGIVSRYLIDRVKPGDTLLTTGAGGLFTLPSDSRSYRQLFLLAAGSGIAPIYALLKATLYFNPAVSVVLIYSNRSPDKAVFLQPLQNLENQFPSTFHLELLFSNRADLRKARLYRELLVSLWKKYSVAPTNQQLFYLCGPLSYMRMCAYVLQGEGVPADHIKRENFNIEKTLPFKMEPPDKRRHTVTILFQGKKFFIETEYPATILQAARSKGIILPYSCEVGRCGNCVAKCKAGSVWLSNNEVLTDKELAQGFVLTCVGYPVNGDVDLEIP